jgi:gas vesicle protein
MSNKPSNVILAVVAGFIAGVAAGLLFAPDKGSVTRKKLKKNLLDLTEGIEKNLTENLDGLKSVFTGDKTNHHKESNH